jgi:hypothetical protein
VTDASASARVGSGARRRQPRFLLIVGLGVVGFSMLIVGLLMADREDGHFSGPSWAIALTALGALTLGAQSAVPKRDGAGMKASDLVMAVAQLLVAYTIAVPHGGVERPTWLTAIGVLALAAALAATVAAVVLWRRSRDERERMIFAAATALAFGCVMVVAAAFTMLDHFSSFDVDLTPTWILLIGAASWVASGYVLRERM